MADLNLPKNNGQDVSRNLLKIPAYSSKSALQHSELSFTCWKAGRVTDTFTLVAGIVLTKGSIKAITKCWSCIRLLSSLEGVSSQT